LAIFVFDDPKSSIKTSEYEENILYCRNIVNMRKELGNLVRYLSDKKKNQTTATSFILPCKKHA